MLIISLDSGSIVGFVSISHAWKVEQCGEETVVRRGTCAERPQAIKHGDLGAALFYTVSLAFLSQPTQRFLFDNKHPQFFLAAVPGPPSSSS